MKTAFVGLLRGFRSLPIALQALGVVSAIALAWALSGLIALAFDDSVSVTTDADTPPTSSVPASTPSSSPPSTSSTVTTPSTTPTTVGETESSTTARPAVTTSTTVAGIPGDGGTDQLCPKGIYTDDKGQAYCVP